MPIVKIPKRFNAKGCPFCGKQPIAFKVLTGYGSGTFEVLCNNRKACKLIVGTFGVKTLAEALAIWNRRSK